MILVLSLNLSRISIHSNTLSVHLKTYRHMPYTDPRYRQWLRLSDFGAWNLIPKSIIPEVQDGLYPWRSVDTFYMTSPNGNIFLTKASGAEFWCFLWSTPWINCWVNICEAGDWNSIAHYDVIVMDLQIHLSVTNIRGLHTWNTGGYFYVYSMQLPNYFRQDSLRHAKH